MVEKVTTTMVLKVNLQCSSCYKKIKKVLCKFPQIQNQAYDEKANTVTITVVCCNPEKIRDKLCCKGGKTIKSIEIKPPPKPEPKTPKEPEKPKVPKEPEKPKVPKEPVKPKETKAEPEKPKSNGKPKDPPAPATAPAAAPAPAPASKAPAPAPKAPERATPAPVPAVGCPPVIVYPFGVCCGNYGACSCYHGYGTPVPCYDGYGYRYGYGYGGHRACYVSRCDYFSEENPSGCTIM